MKTLAKYLPEQRCLDNGLLSMKSIRLRILVTVILSMSIAQVGAQLVTDRPDQTESSSTVGKGKLQIEAGLLIGTEGDSPNASRQILAPTTLFRYGISRGIELRFMGQFESIKVQDQTIRGISDIEIGAKFQLYQKEDSRTEVAFLTHLLLPTAPEGLSNDAFGTINKLAVSHELNDQLGLGYNIGFNYLGSGKGDLTYSLMLGYSASEKIGIYVEPYGEYVGLENFRQNFDAGITYLLKDNIQLDFSFGTGINYRMNYLSVGVCWKSEG
jgi:hypothetical protein